MDIGKQLKVSITNLLGDRMGICSYVRGGVPKPSPECRIRGWDPSVTESHSASALVKGLAVTMTSHDGDSQ